MGIYLDYNASAPVDARVLDAMVSVYRNDYGNPDSRTHEYGERSATRLNQARGQVAELLGIAKDEVVFTSGATESNNLAILGLELYGIQMNRKHIITTSIEHKAVLEAVHHLEKKGFDVDYIDPDQSGRINANDLIQRLRPDTLLVSVMHANNETGVLQPVERIGEILELTDTFFHIDATQTCGKMVEAVKNLQYDLLSCSAHKMYGPQGIGALIIRKKHYQRVPIKPIMFGGGQEYGFRPGTTPVPLAMGFGVACNLAKEKAQEHLKQMEAIRNTILALLEESEIQYKINGNLEYAVPNTLNISIKGISSEALMLTTRQLCGISNGSACTTSNYKPSYVLTAMGLSEDRLESAVRISWGWECDLDEIRIQFNALLNSAKLLIL